MWQLITIAICVVIIGILLGYILNIHMDWDAYEADAKWYKKMYDIIIITSDCERAHLDNSTFQGIRFADLFNTLYNHGRLVDGLPRNLNEFMTTPFQKIFFLLDQVVQWDHICEVHNCSVLPTNKTKEK